METMKKTMDYPKNQSVARFVDYATDKKINETMTTAVKDSASKIAGYLDFISGYWPDYEKHIIETSVTIADLREASQDHPTLPGKRWDYWPKEIQNKVFKLALKEHNQRVRTVREMGAFLNKQQETMGKFTPEAAARMEAIQDTLAA
jgi:hypothetical protein